MKRIVVRPVEHSGFRSVRFRSVRFRTGKEGFKRAASVAGLWWKISLTPSLSYYFGTFSSCIPSIPFLPAASQGNSKSVIKKKTLLDFWSRELKLPGDISKVFVFSQIYSQF